MTLFLWLAGLEGLGAEVCEEEPVTVRVSAGVGMSKEDEEREEGTGVLSGEVAGLLVWVSWREWLRSAKGRVSSAEFSQPASVSSCSSSVLEL